MGSGGGFLTTYTSLSKFLKVALSTKNQSIQITKWSWELLASLSTSRLCISHVDLSSLKQLDKLEPNFTGIKFLNSSKKIVYFLKCFI
jgi:hypothetical protein